MVGGECCGCVGFGLGVYLVVWVSGLVLGGVCLFCWVRRGFCGLFRGVSGAALVVLWFVFGLWVGCSFVLCMFAVVGLL